MYKHLKKSLNDNKTIAIRADGNATLGMGHIMRCISIAKALQSVGGACIFFTAEEQAAEFIREKGFLCENLHTDYKDMESEVPRLQELADKYNPGLWLVDSYQITAEYIKMLQQICPVFYLDDTGERIYEADGLINYNIYGAELGYEERCPENTQLLLGAAYAPVKQEFVNTSYMVSEEVENILITMGGSDVLNITGQLSDCLLCTLPEKVKLTLICGRFNPHLQKLQALQAENSRIRVLVDVPDMWNHFARADIVVSAAGSTMYELSTIGVPTVCCYYVENQRRLAEGFAEKVELCNAGDYSKEPEAVLKRMVDAVSAMVGDKEYRQKLSKRMQGITDGQGAAKIAEELLAFIR
jgi:UDP-2,4-diacetamido-2,4,6-trideoxy-beta-L-altropyranose hydrolase